MNVCRFHKRKAIGLIEIVIAAILVVSAGVPILYMVTSSRTETSSSVNYLRAVELADEALEWASASKFSEVDKLANLSGTIIEDNSGSAHAVALNVAEAENQSWKTSEVFASSLNYSDQYATAYFYREILVEDVKGTYFSDDLLKKVTVIVSWSEGYKPSNLNVASNRSRRVELATLVINDENLLY